MQTSKYWLRPTSWDQITQLHADLCQNKNVPTDKNRGHDAARHLWEKEAPKEMRLFEAIEVCRKCNDLIPFTFNSGNTFASISTQLVKDWTQLIPSLERHMMETAIAHYVNGKISRSELKSTLRHLEGMIEKSPAPAAVMPAAPPIVSTSPHRRVPA